jgi:hypothetical protein
MGITFTIASSSFRAREQWEIKLLDPLTKPTIQTARKKLNKINLQRVPGLRCLKNLNKT